MKPLAYHNFSHVVDVVEAARKIGSIEQVSEEEAFLLETAAYLHDVVYEVGAQDNEERSVDLSRSFLRSVRYSSAQINEVSQLILATKVPTNPAGHLQQIICDADLDNLGRDDFLEKSNALLREWGAKEGREWNKRTYDFLMSHRYYTQAAIDLRQQGLERNREILRELMG